MLFSLSVRKNAIAYLALFVALGGTSYAAINLPAGSVGTRQLRAGAVTAVKVGLIEVIAIIRGCDGFCGALFKGLLVKAVGVCLVLFRGHSASVLEGGKCCSWVGMRGQQKAGQEPAEKLCPS